MKSLSLITSLVDVAWAIPARHAHGGWHVGLRRGFTVRSEQETVPPWIAMVRNCLDAAGEDPLSYEPDDELRLLFEPRCRLSISQRALVLDYFGQWHCTASYDGDWEDCVVHVLTQWEQFKYETKSST